MPDGVTYHPEVNAPLAGAFLDIIISKRITVARTQVGLDADFFVNRVTTSIIDKRIQVKYNVIEADASSYLKLNDPTYAVLNAAVSRLAF